MNKVNSFIVRNSIDNKWLKDKMLQITQSGQQHFINGRYPIYILDSYEELNQYLDSAEFLFVQTAGDYILDFDTLWDNLHSIPDDIGLLAHIIWYETSTTPFINEQCFVIRTSAIHSRPIKFYSNTVNGPTFIKSEVDMHTGHAPLWVDHSGIYGTRDDGFGTELMSKIISNGFRVSNFDMSWRFSKSNKLPVSPDRFDISKLPVRAFLYPHLNTELFAHCLKTVTLNPELDDAQYTAIQVIQELLKFSYVNVYHWDSINTNFPANLVISPANGFMGEAIALSANAKRIIFYDINENNINFKKYLYENFDGTGYEKFFSTYTAKRGLGIEPACDFGIESAEIEMEHTNMVLNNWETVKTIEREYVTGDLFDILDILLSKINTITILHTSTILGYYIFSNILHDQDEIDLVKQKIQNKITSTNSLWIRET